MEKAAAAESAAARAGEAAAAAAEAQEKAAPVPAVPSASTPPSPLPTPALDLGAAAARRRRAGEAGPATPPPAPQTSVGAAFNRAAVAATLARERGRAGGARAASAARAGSSSTASAATPAAAASARRRRAGAPGAVSGGASAIASAAALPIGVGGVGETMPAVALGRAPPSASAAAAAASTPAPAVTRAAARPAGVARTAAAGVPTRGSAASKAKAAVKATARATTASLASPSTLGPLHRTIAHNPLLTSDDERELSSAVQDALALDAVRAAMAASAGGVSPTWEAWAARAGCASSADLRARLAAGAAARDRMLGANTRLVLSIARKYGNKGSEYEDLVVEGMTGLARAIDKFDPSRGFKFSTYAHWWVRQAVTRSISEQARVIRLPVHLHEAMARVKKAEAALEESLGRPPSDAETAAAAGMAPDRLEALKRVYVLPRSADEAAGGSEGATGGPGAPPSGGGEDGGGEGGGDLGENAESETTPPDGAPLLVSSLATAVEGILQTLAPRERGVLRMRYGLDDGRPKTLEEIGAAFAVTRERIRQIESKALLKLRAPERCGAGLEEYMVAYTEVGELEAEGQEWRSATTKSRES